MSPREPWMSATPACDRRLVGDVEGAHARRVAGLGELLDGGVELRPVAAVDDDARAGRGKPFGDREPQSRAAAGDERQAPVEIERMARHVSRARARRACRRGPLRPRARFAATNSTARSAPLAKSWRDVARCTSSTRSPSPANTTVCSPTTSPPRSVAKPIVPGLRSPVIAVPRVDRVLGERASRAGGRGLAEAQRGARRRVDLVLVVHLDDLDVERRPERARRLLDERQQHVDADAHVRGEHDRNVLRVLRQRRASARRRSRWCPTTAPTLARTQAARCASVPAGRVKSISTSARASAASTSAVTRMPVTRAGQFARVAAQHGAFGNVERGGERRGRAARASRRSAPGPSDRRRPRRRRECDSWACSGVSGDRRGASAREPSGGRAALTLLDRRVGRVPHLLEDVDDLADDARRPGRTDPPAACASAATRFSSCDRLRHLVAFPARERCRP